MLGHLDCSMLAAKAADFVYPDGFVCSVGFCLPGPLGQNGVPASSRLRPSF